MKIITSIYHSKHSNGKYFDCVNDILEYQDPTQYLPQDCDAMITCTYGLLFACLQLVYN